MQSVRLKDLKCRHLHVCPCRYTNYTMCTRVYRTDSRYTPLRSTRIDLSVHFALFYLPLVVFATPPAALLSQSCCTCQAAFMISIYIWLPAPAWLTGCMPSWVCTMPLTINVHSAWDNTDAAHRRGIMFLCSVLFCTIYGKRKMLTNRTGLVCYCLAAMRFTSDYQW